MDETLTVSRDYEIRFVRWLMHRRFLLLAIVCALVVAMAGAVIAALWLTRVKEEMPGMLVRTEAGAGRLIIEMNAERAARLAVGRSVEVIAKDAGGDATAPVIGAVSRVDPLPDGGPSGFGGSVAVVVEGVEVPPDWNGTPDVTGRREVTVTFRGIRALSLVLERNFRGTGAKARGGKP